MLTTFAALLLLVSAAIAALDVKACWRNSTCDGLSKPSFPGPWDAYNFAPSSRFVAPQTLLSLPNGAQIGKYNENATTIQATSEGYVFDFGLEVGGILSFDYSLSGNVTNATIGLAFTEAKDYIGRKSDNSNGGTGQDNALLWALNGRHDGHYVMPDASLRGGFRYLTIFLTTDPGAVVTIRNVNIEISFQPTWPNLRAYQGYFYSSEDLLDKIWYSGAYTLQTNSVPGTTGRANVQTNRVGWDNAAYIGPGDTVLLDGAKRDRWVWIGDMGTAVPAAFVSTGDMESTRNALRAIFDNQSADGTLPKAGPPYLSKDSDTYHLWALIGFYNYYLYIGDEAFLQSYWSKYVLGVNKILSKVNDKGIVNVTGTADWGRWVYSSERSSASMLLYRALVTASSIASWSPNLPDASAHRANWSTAAASLQTSIITHLWDEARGAFRESPSDTSLHPQDANSMALAFEVLNASDQRAQRVSTYLTTNWTPIGAINPELSANISTISPFISSIELEGHFKIGHPERSLALIRSAWGWYVNNPNGTQSTVPEGYLADGSWGYRGDRGYRNDPSYVSHAHGWSSGPTSTLTEYLVGLRVTEPQGRRWELKPSTFEEVERAEAGFTTALGKFSAKFSGENGTVRVWWDTPVGTEGFVQFPGQVGKIVKGGKGSTIIRSV
ncbi:glycoside hydrolase family 78 protein [Macroventuria anomochaeta]|uniref:Glycoside hydrolase family 78 protein n=1 Tax=Macroventuria anomochaeta TaxID=301207 RepID=A0ACB6RJK3_9PLEO|nr:glycoside hydrolase family 78 protein [Macroventuria anomochaeta]KAF2621344.1 glycoside hydrolase family 78 protein [Macroventuria anomochaeta]